ncbi:iron transporter FeoA [Marinithermofilum abyssi]|uniref:Iron transporter FeoA n=1 Tax=Marinithermofilum abyssi TaxID=1571185 RepID=A0A8J2VIA0_9BACL|nr:FeoA family protein [Marinithermofilum abyssi]GGE18894.1 iron transporter FeoA [Marinithermofilum abyssi]
MGESTAIPLAEAKPGQFFRIHRLSLDGTMRRRLLDLGFIPGAEVKVLQKSPLGDPMAFLVANTTIALRKEESAQIYGEIIGERGDHHG